MSDCNCDSNTPKYAKVASRAAASRVGAERQTTTKNNNSMSKGLNLCGLMYQKFAASITLTATVKDGSGVDQITFPDSDGLMLDLGVISSNTTQVVEVSGKVSLDAVHKWLFSWAGNISMINYKSTSDLQTANRINFISSGIDSKTGTVTTFDPALAESNMQFQQGLQTLFPSDGAAILAANTGIVADHVLAVGADITTSLTLKFDKWMSYSDLYKIEC